MGDRDGDLRSFEDIQDDIAAAIDRLFREVPRLREVVLWGLLDAACAIAICAAGDARVGGLVMLNPWVRTPEGEAKAYFQHYYIRRLLSRIFWSKVFSGDLNLRDSLHSLLGFLQAPKDPRRPSREPAADGQPYRHIRTGRHRPPTPHHPA